MLVRVLVLLVLSVLAFAGCAPAPGPTPTPTPSPAPQVVATRWTALLVGELVREGDCLRVVDAVSGTSYLLVWPAHQHSVRVEDEVVQVTDHLRGDTVVAWRVGETVSLGGGEVSSLEYLAEDLRKTLPANCPGPYWIVGDVEIRGP